MEIWQWALGRWFEILSLAVGIGGLLFAAIAHQFYTRTRKEAEIIAITANHRQIWNRLLDRPHLGRILDKSHDLINQPISIEDQEFVNSVILHLNSVHAALRGDIVIRFEGVREDVSSFLSLPIPKSVWTKVKTIQNKEFVAFVEECLRGGAILLGWFAGRKLRWAEE